MEGDEIYLSDEPIVDLIVHGVPIATPRIMTDVSNKIILDGSTNYANWRDDVLLQLGCMDLDYALRYEKPPRLDDASNDKEAKERYELWERSNHLSLLLIQQRITRSIRGAIPKCETAKGYLEALDKQFKPIDKQMVGAIMSELCVMRLTGIGGVRQHIMKMRDLAS
ncbi:uncharacterized protein LOC114727185 [Neltuma alba]|uniref:uncharacterized protein LOC114727185 n=1 Tax=Neltuma alba TaxID=207710 RepID=UPI0010A47298|nr:uncharacterized protein LOC114727185 [Prosopis alba]